MVIATMKEECAWQQIEIDVFVFRLLPNDEFGILGLLDRLMRRRTQKGRRN